VVGGLMAIDMGRGGHCERAAATRSAIWACQITRSY
jgi:hypothetical protein